MDSKTRLLRSMGKSWFISYLYYLKIDNQHLNWQNSNLSQKALQTRISNFNNSKEFYKIYLNEIIKSNPSSLDTNKLGLSGEDIIMMSNELIKANGI